MVEVAAFVLLSKEMAIVNGVRAASSVTTLPRVRAEHKVEASVAEAAVLVTHFNEVSAIVALAASSHTTKLLK
jgi:hypothetical protein